MTLPRLMVVGSRADLSDLCGHLEGAGRYRIYFVSPGRVGERLQPKPDLVLLHVPEERDAAERVLASIGTLRREAPVVVISRAADMNLYLTAMAQGAFDYITCYTPAEEVARVLRSALRWQSRRVA